MVGKRTEVKRGKEGERRTTAAIHETDQALPAHRELQFSGNHLSAPRCYTFPPPPRPPAHARRSGRRITAIKRSQIRRDRYVERDGVSRTTRCPLQRLTLLSFPSYRWSIDRSEEQSAQNATWPLADCREIPRWRSLWPRTCAFGGGEGVNNAR